MKKYTVLQDDDGIRPAGAPDECCYCGQKVGQTHKDDCVMIKTKWKVRLCYEIEIEYPLSWGKDEVEYSLNEGSGCADNYIWDIIAKSAKNGCACCGEMFYGEAIEQIPESTSRKTHSEAGTSTKERDEYIRQFISKRYNIEK